MVGFNINGDNNCGTICSDSNSSVTIEEIAAIIGIRLIKVPKRSPAWPLPHQSEKPELFCDKNIPNKNIVFIVAGMGVVAGEDMYERLNDGNTVLWWE